jgi:hypothetical protein
MGRLILINPQRKFKLPKSKAGSRGRKGNANPGIGKGIGGRKGRGGRGIPIAGKLKAGIPGKGGRKQNSGNGGIPPNNGKLGITKLGS